MILWVHLIGRCSMVKAEKTLRISDLSGLTDTDLDFENRFCFSHIERKPGKPGVTGYTGFRKIMRTPTLLFKSLKESREPSWP